jgi:hypothetical protein
MRTQLAFTSGDDTKAQLVGDKTTVFPGIMNRICVWVDSATGGTVVLFSLANGSDSDGPVYGYVFGAGAPHALGMAAARAVYGGFEVSDLNGDGRYELITARNLDGMAGGFNYHAVRAFNGTDYATDPDRFKDYFQRELDFLNWVVATRDEIQADPEKYMRRPKQQQEKLVGYAYVATYGKESYGFDTLVELPPDAAAAKLDTSKYNQLRREAYRRVTTYRDQLQSWLAGGAHPAVWGLPR